MEAAGILALRPQAFGIGEMSPKVAQSSGLWPAWGLLFKVLIENLACIFQF